MTIKTKSIANLPLSALMAFLVTTLLFVAIPLLTKISTMKKKTERVTRAMISHRKPPPPPEPEKEKKLEEQKKREAPKEAQQRRERMPRPKLNVQSSGLTADMGGTIAISGLLRSDFEVNDSLFVSAFNLNEVDQHPRPIRRVNPTYPFDAKQKGIEASVTIRFVVDSNGIPQEPEIYEVEPKDAEGYFEEAALACIKKFKFNPAKKNGKAVDVIVRQKISFNITD